MKTKIGHISIGIILFMISAWLVTMYIYSQRYVQDSPNTATTGIIFKKTLKLDAYQNVASGNGILGKYDRYSRSDRHSEVITVYCKNYCQE